MVYGVIMAGGRGERFWPLSRMDRPKQFLRLTSDQTMLEETILRVGSMISPDRIRIVAGESMSRMVEESCDLAQPEMLLTEPFGRNTSLPSIDCKQADPLWFSVSHLSHRPPRVEDNCTLPP